MQIAQSMSCAEIREIGQVYKDSLIEVRVGYLPVSGSSDHFEMQSGHWCTRSERKLYPQSVSSTDLSCCALHEWPVSPPRGGVDDFAIAAFSVLRAHAAEKLDSQIGLRPSVSCAVCEGPVWAESVCYDDHGFTVGDA